jgi:chromosomal replication initiator protein
VGAIYSGDRDRNIAHARQTACWLLRQQGMSLKAVGTALGGLDHTTVMYACRVIEKDAGRLALARQLLAQEAAA